MKFSKLFKVSFLSIASMLLSSSLSFAALTLDTTKTIDTTSDLSLTWNWTGGTSSNDYLPTYPRNWQANLSFTQIAGVPGDFNVSLVGFQHVIGPHANDQMPGQYNLFQNFLFHGQNISLSGYVDHGLTDSSIPHHDNWSFTLNGLTGEANLKVSHTPIPPSAILMFSGVLGMFGIGRKRLFV